MSPRSTPASLRTARPEDYPHVAHLFAQLGSGDPAPSREVFEREWLSRTHLLARGAGASEAPPHGIAVVDALRDTGYVRVVVVDAAERGRGQGLALMHEVAALLRAAGCARWCLNVRPENAPAVGLYTKLGLRAAYDACSYVLPYRCLEALPEAPTRTVARAVEPRDDAALEARYELPAGQLAHWRALQGQLLLRLDDEGAPDDAEPRGFARFTPSFPGAFPFRVASDAYARALAEACRARALPHFEHLRVMVEGAPSLDALLAAAGATPALRVTHMSGPLPAP